MGREIKRVPLDFDWPLNEVWSGFLMPDKFDEEPCPDCKNGYAPHAQHLHDLWYGNIPFDPRSTGSVPLHPGTAAVRAFAERNVTRDPAFYRDAARAHLRGSGARRAGHLRALIDHPTTSEDEKTAAQAALGRLLDGIAIEVEATRLAHIWNRQWSHHLSQDDVDALVAGGRLWDFTRKIGPNGWEDRDPPVVPTAEQVNEWSLRGMAHDSINAGVAIQARCERDGEPYTCQTCDGHGSLEAYEGQRAEAEAWESEEPPAGEGWQVWETVSEGSPISPVFPVREGLIVWLMSPAYTWGVSQPLTRSQAEGFVTDAWAPSLISSPSTGLIPGDQACEQRELTGKAERGEQ